MPVRPLVGTLLYLWDRSSDRVLMVHRGDGDHRGKFNGLGGKLERDEHLVGSLRREIREEAGIELDGLSLRGTITWSGFGSAAEDWLGLVFLADGYVGEVLEHNAEGSLHWVERTRLLAACDPDPDRRKAAELPMWEGDRHFLPLVFDDDARQFHGTMRYDGDAPRSWSVTRL